MKNWKKGSLHCHTMWSDAAALPEMAIKMYQEAGYDFVCLSDHNVFQDDTAVWTQVRGEAGAWPPMLSGDEYLRTKDIPGVMLIEKNVSFKKYIRLKTYEELKSEFEIPGKFVLVPGMELTGGGESFGVPGRVHAIHCNIFNLAENVPLPHGGSDVEYLRAMLDAYKSAATEDSFFMLNHPWYNAWDVDPRLLIDFTEIRLFEICNNGTNVIPENWIYNREKYWDFILAHRIAAGAPLLYGTAGDDAHSYDPSKPEKSSNYGSAFVMVNCSGAFTAPNLVKAILSGDFYPSCGVLLDEIEFDEATGTLNVKVKAEAGVNYRIDFITTEVNFDRNMEIAEFPHEKEVFSRTRPIIPDGIGEIVSSIDGTCGSYTMSPDDLYVRAIITSDKVSKMKVNFFPANQCAWTQPFKNPSVGK